MKFYVSAATVALLMFLSALARGTEPPTAKPEADKKEAIREKTTAKDILEAYRQAVYEKLYPKLPDSRLEDMHELAAQLATEHLIPNRELLHHRAERLLESLPELDAGRLDGMQPVLNEDEQKQVEAVIGKSSGLPREDKELPEDTVGMLMASSLWNPMHAAKAARAPSMVRVLGTTEYGKRALLESLAPSKIAALDKNSEKPAIAFLAGPEVFIVWLEYSSDGYYTPIRVKWLAEVAKEQ